MVYYTGYYIIHARWFYDRICTSNTLCSASSAQLPQLVSKKFFEEEIFAGTNFRELAFDRENRENRENFCLAKISRYTVVSQLVTENLHGYFIESSG